jgi:hypothetical protein
MELTKRAELLSALLPLLPSGGGGGWEKRAGVMRGPAPRPPLQLPSPCRSGIERSLGLRGTLSALRKRFEQELQLGSVIVVQFGIGTE